MKKHFKSLLWHKIEEKFFRKLNEFGKLQKTSFIEHGSDWLRLEHFDSVLKLKKVRITASCVNINK